MIQTIIVFIIIFLALCGVVYYLRKKLRSLKKGRDCSSCSGCPLKEKCSGIVPGQNKGSGCCG